MSPSLVLILIGGGAVLGIIGYVYHQGKQSCISFYEHKIEQTKRVNAEKEAKNYKESAEFNEQLLGEANIEMDKLRGKGDKLQLEIDQIKSTKYVCVSADFLRGLARLRSTGSEKENPGPTK